MCGFAGLIALDNNDNSLEVLRKMNNALAHRGPDDHGAWQATNIGLVHRRLAILDQTKKASQPMTSESERYVLVYNGEIYNFKEIREELSADGVKFNSNGDTEVVLASLIKWGTKAIPKFNGMFSFAFYDSATKKLILARDRYGIKPLYFHYNGSLLVFASEEKAIRLHPLYRVNLDLLALVEYFTFQNILTNRTFYEGIESVSPGTFLEVFFDSKNIYLNHKQYWDFKFQEESSLGDQNEQKEEVERLFSQAVNRCLISDAAVGQYLSSGIDTALIATEASNKISNMNTFTIGFNSENATGLELGFDERTEAAALARYLGTLHHEYELQPGDMQSCIPELSKALDTPRVGQSYPNFFAAQLASRHVKVVLSGTGSDEIFGGYPWRYFAAMGTENFHEFSNAYYNYWQRLVPDQLKPQVFKPVWDVVRDYNTKDIFYNILRAHEGDKRGKFSNLNSSLYLEAKSFLIGLLNIEDKIHMHFGIENRVPYLDNDLVDFVLRLDPALKINNFGKNVYSIDENTSGDKKSFLKPSESGKRVLREIYESRLPTFGGWKEKKGFAGPDSSWFRGPSIGYLRHELLEKNHKMYDYLEFGEVSRVLENHISGRENRRLLLWSYLSLKNWLDINL